MRRFLGTTGATLLILAATTTSTFASRAALDARAFPRDLALDPCNAFAYPGSVPSFAPQVLLDDDLALGLAGRSLRIGYMDDAGTHALVLAVPSGWGLGIGFRDRYEDRESFVESSSGFTATDETEWERMFLVHLGAHRRSASGRSYEAVLTGALSQGEQGTKVQDFRNPSEPVSFGFRWKSSPGLGAGFRLRTLSAKPGPLAVVGGDYFDRRPEGKLPITVSSISRNVFGEFGWRLPYAGLNDFVVGATVSWSDAQVIDLSGSTTLFAHSNRERKFLGQLFVSGERSLLPALVVRGGATASVHDTRDASLHMMLRSGDEEPLQDDRTATRTRTLGEPGISIGAGWRQAPFIFDAQVTSYLSLDYFIARWALTVELH